MLLRRIKKKLKNICFNSLKTNLFDRVSQYEVTFFMSSAIISNDFTNRRFGNLISLVNLNNKYFSFL